MRMIAALASLAALGALWFGAVELRQVWAGEAAPVALRVAQVGEPQPPQPGAAGPQLRPWPALFGQVVVAEPQPPQPPAAPQPPASASPPVASLGYSLKGTVEISGSVWAIVSHPTGDTVLRVGDDLVPGAKVVAIDAEGLWVETTRGREVLEFTQ